MLKFVRPLALACVLLAACETTPVQVEMDSLTYQQIYDDAQNTGSVIYADRVLTDLVNRADLSPAQRAEAQLLRAKQRQKFAFNLPGAIADYRAYQAFLALQPEATVPAQIATDLSRAERDVAAARSRLSGLQTLDKWFADKTLLGELDAAAARQRSSRITPTDLHTYLLSEAGYICDVGDQGGAKIHHFGPEPAYAKGKVWCAAPETS